MEMADILLRYIFIFNTTDIKVVAVDGNITDAAESPTNTLDQEGFLLCIVCVCDEHLFGRKT